VSAVRSTICCRFFAQAIVAALPIALAAAAASDPAHTLAQFLPAVPLWSIEIAAAPAVPPVIGPAQVIAALQSGSVQAFSIGTGKPIWQLAFHVDRPLEIDGGRLVAGGNGEVRVLDAADGKPIWSRTIGALTAPLLASGGWIIAATSGQLVALRTEDGQEVWRQDSTGQVERATIEGGTLYVPLSSGPLRALDLTSGAEKWSTRFGGAPTEVLALADRVYVGSTDKYFYCLDPANGRVSWRFNVGAPMRGKPAADDRRVYVGSIDNQIRAFDRRSGALRWSKDARFRPTVGPTVIGPIVLVSAGAALELHAWAAATGDPAGQLVFSEPLAEAAAITGSTLAAVTGGLNEQWKLSLFGQPLPSIDESPLKILPGVSVTIRPPGR
jgi:outer membrane protein assembly factor BamB